jgi:opacity protein-like surface antigen
MKSLLAVAALAAAVIVPAASQAAAPGYCHHYADLAVWQYHRAMEHGCIGGPSLRWNGNWDGHYSWCLGADYWAARHEDDIRGHRLHEC